MSETAEELLAAMDRRIAALQRQAQSEERPIPERVLEARQARQDALRRVLSAHQGLGRRSLNVTVLRP